MKDDNLKRRTIEIVIKAGEILRRHYHSKEMKIDYKGNIDLVTQADFDVESFIVNSLEKLTGIRCFAEESHKIEPHADRFWLVDPLDGTTNFAHRYPVFSISLALLEEGRIKMGVVYDPLRRELFFAEAGRGAYLNNRRIKVSEVSQLSRALLATGFPYDVWSTSENLKEFSNFLRRVQGIRRSGSAAIDLSYVACGRLDGFWEPGLKPWDMAAGALLVKEAGGRVTDYEGGEFNPFKPFIVASNSLIHEQMLDVINSI